MGRSRASWFAALMGVFATASCGSDEGGTGGTGGSAGSAAGTGAQGGSGGSAGTGSGGRGGAGAQGGAAGSAGTGPDASGGVGGRGGSAGAGGTGGTGDASSCGELGAECSGSCASGFECKNGVCVPERPMCGGFASAECPETFPVCLYCVGCDYGPCFRQDEVACVCRGAGRTAFQCTGN